MSKVTIVLDNAPHTKALKDGTLTSPDVELAFKEYKPVTKAFDEMVATQPFDVCEMAVVTYLQAADAGKPIKLLPIVTAGEFHHGSLWYNPETKMAPADLKGKKVGVRAYTQTTGLWVRGVLQEQYGVPSSEVTWVTTEAPHVAEYKCPDNVEVAEGANLAEMVRNGELAAVIQGTKQGGPAGLEQMIPNREEAIAQWYDKHKLVPVNHMVVFKEDTDPAMVKAVYDLLCKGIDEAYPAADRKEPFAYVYGVDKVWGVVELAMQYCLEQGLISRRFTKEEVFAKEFLA